MLQNEMSILAQEQKLFREWKKTRRPFVPDGVVAEQEYLSSNPKIAVILKEVNDPNGGGWDLREFIASGGRARTWNNVARWVHGIRNINSLPDWEVYREITKEFRTENLKGICAINLKKSPGSYTSNKKELSRVINEDRDYIQQQYEMYDPDITICCGIAELFRDALSHNGYKWKETTRGVWWYERAKNKYVVSFVHPEARVKASLLVYGLVDAVAEIFRPVM